MKKLSPGSLLEKSIRMEEGLVLCPLNKGISVLQQLQGVLSKCMQSIPIIISVLFFKRQQNKLFATHFKTCIKRVMQTLITNMPCKSIWRIIKQVGNQNWKGLTDSDECVRQSYLWQKSLMEYLNTGMCNIF